MSAIVTGLTRYARLRLAARAEALARGSTVTEDGSPGHVRVDECRIGHACHSPRCGVRARVSSVREGESRGRTDLDRPTRLLRGVPRGLARLVPRLERVRRRAHV